MSAPAKEVEAFMCPEHGLMEPAPTNSGLDPWLGAWWICSRGDRPGVSQRSTLVPSTELKALWAELEEEQRRLERKNEQPAPAQMTIPLAEVGLAEKTEKETNR